MLKNNLLAVFDLDFTVWDCSGTWCDHTSPPYRKSNGKLIDRTGRIIRLYDNILPLFSKLRNNGVQIASASRTGEPAWAKNLLMLFGIYDCFNYHEIYPSCKIDHFRSLHLRSGIDYCNMIFFDDEHRNIEDVGSLGVTTCHVTDSNRDRMGDALDSWFKKLCGAGM
ncbi:MAG: magnesium-dependent phosphatase-1 [Fibrobacter sp.]|nr:magnesium-dependent phosphatase-1 [Fibrobacter sp.]